MTERTASCSCGGLRAICQGEPARVSTCHCYACQRRTGSAFSYNATFRRDQVEVVGASSTYQRESDEGRWGLFRFCPSCGATVAYEIEARPGMVSIPVGAFADATFPEPTISVFGKRRHPWVRYATAVPITEE